MSQSNSPSPINHQAASLSTECDPVSPSVSPPPRRPIPECGEGSADDLGWLEEAASRRLSNGRANFADAQQTGKIVNDPQAADKGVVYRYSRALRGADEAMLSMFNDLVVIDDDGREHPVPIIWGTQERAVAAILQDNVRQDTSLVVDRVRLPMLAIHSEGFNFNQDRYTYHKALHYSRKRPDKKPSFHVAERWNRDTIMGVSRGIPLDISYRLVCWTLYQEDMLQLVEQIVSKFSPVAYIEVRGVSWETQVKIDSIANNLDTEPGDQSLRVVKFEFGFTAETYVPQPIVRRKAVLKTRVDVYVGDEAESAGTFERLEQAVSELS